MFGPLLIATGEAIPLRGLEGVPGLPGAPQDPSPTESETEGGWGGGGAQKSDLKSLPRVSDIPYCLKITALVT